MVDPDKEDIIECEPELFQLSTLLEARDSIFICPNCNKHFTNSETFKKHTDKRICDIKYTCNFCHTIFGRSDHLKRHINCVHKSEINTLCPICREKCDGIKEVGKHVRKVHTGTLVFPCRVCCFECDSYNELRQHETSHLNVVPNQCVHCNTIFKRRDHMLRHIQSLHLNATFKCSMCDHNFKRKDHLTRHLRDKHKSPIFVN